MIVCVGSSTSTLMTSALNLIPMLACKYNVL